MIAFKNLKDILKVSINWEKELNDLYDVAELGLANPRSREVIAELKARHEEKLQVLMNLDVEKYGLNEWIRFASSFKDDEVIPKGRINRNSSPGEIFSFLKEGMEKMKNFYSSLESVLATRKQQELFSSLVMFKALQMEEIGNLQANVTPAE